LVPKGPHDAIGVAIEHPVFAEQSLFARCVTDIG
jgi:hypothetical protein